MAGFLYVRANKKSPSGHKTGGTQNRKEVPVVRLFQKTLLLHTLLIASLYIPVRHDGLAVLK